MTSSPITWFGGKSRLARKIINLFPPHHCYVEVFGCSMAVLLAKSPAKVEVYNDVDKGLVNLFRVIRDETLSTRLRQQLELTPYAREEFNLARQLTNDPVENARRFMVKQCQSFGGLGHTGSSWSWCREDHVNNKASTIMRWDRAVNAILEAHRRIRDVQIECADFREIIPRYDAENTLFYLDPPYVHGTRGKNRYVHEIDASDHADLVDLLLSIKGKAILSGYSNEIYITLTDRGWERRDYNVRCYAHRSGALKRTESLWLSPAAARQHTGLFA